MGNNDLLTKEKKLETITRDEIIDLLKQFEGLKKKLHNLLKKL